MRSLALIAVFMLAGCSGSFEIGRPRAPAVIPAPAGAATIIEPDGTVIEEKAPIETVITGLSQAQQVRVLARQLAH